MQNFEHEKTIHFEEKTEENRFFIYKYNEDLLINKSPENYMIMNNPIEYIDGFTIKDNKIEVTKRDEGLLR